MPKPGFSALEIVNISSAHVPADRATGRISQGLITNEKQSVRPVFSSGPLLIFKRLASRQRFLSFVSQPLDIFGMKDSIAKVGLHYVGNGKARVIQHCLIGINNSAVRVQDRDRLRNSIDYLLKVDGWF